MKRPVSNPADRPETTPVPRVAVGRSGTSVVADLLTGSCRGLQDLELLPADDASLIAEFADFVSAGESEEQGGELPAPDPDFRERLRRRLWRQHVQLRLRDLVRSH